MREIFIERRDKTLRIAIKESDKLLECFIEEETFEPIPGEIYKGVVKNIVPAIKCAFVDIGHGKNAYMYVDSKFNNTKIKKGQEVLVEVIKEELGEKGAKVSNIVSVPGRYTVVTNGGKDISFSKKIEDEAFKKAILDSIKKPEEAAVIIRTNAQFASVETIKEEIEMLYEKFKDIVVQYKHTLNPRKLFGEGSILFKVLRDCVTSSTTKIVVDNKEDFHSIERFIEGKPEINLELDLYEGYRSLFDYYQIEKEILSLRHNKVTLQCGGHIVIDKTEAMYVVDVNSGKNVGGKSMDKTAYITNLQAAEEIARQIRLRNLSGIIVVDFIDMPDEGHRKEVIEALEKGFGGDKNKTVIYPFTELNLVQIARRRKGKNIYDYMEEPCRCCKGNGKRLKLSYISLLIRNEILRVDAENNIKDIYIEVNELYEEAVKGNKIQFLGDIGALDKNIYLNFVPSVEYFHVEPLIFMNQIENVKKYKITYD